MDLPLQITRAHTHTSIYKHVNTHRIHSYDVQTMPKIYVLTQPNVDKVNRICQLLCAHVLYVWLLLYMYVMYGTRTHTHTQKKYSRIQTWNMWIDVNLFALCAAGAEAVCWYVTHTGFLIWKHYQIDELDDGFSWFSLLSFQYHCHTWWRCNLTNADAVRYPHGFGPAPRLLCFTLLFTKLWKKKKLCTMRKYTHIHNV